MSPAPSLGFEERGHRRTVEGVHPDAVDGVRREDDELPSRYRPGGRGDPGLALVRVTAIKWRTTQSYDR
jgi:hypothetical protein